MTRNQDSTSFIMQGSPVSEDAAAECGTDQRELTRRKRLWASAEDDRLVAAVARQGPRNWPAVARFVGGRSSNQCRDRWHNYLSPAANCGPWSEAEEWRLFLLQRVFGNRWALIADHMGDRTDNTIKNHWNAGMRSRLLFLEQQLASALALQCDNPEAFECAYHPIDLKLVELFRDRASAPCPPAEVKRKIRKNSRAIRGVEPLVAANSSQTPFVFRDTPKAIAHCVVGSAKAPVMRGGSEQPRDCSS